MKPQTFPVRAAAALFIQRQQLDRPRGRRLTAASLTRFAEQTGGLQIDSINVLDRAHYLTAWSRFGAYDHAALDRLIYRKRVLFEYWAHAACFVSATQLTPWRRAMLNYERTHTGWSGLQRNAKVLEFVESAIRERGPLANADFEHARPAGSKGWWSWKPSQHAIHYLWMTGRIAVHSRAHFQKRFDIAERILPALADVEPPTWDQFLRWHVRHSFHAMGAATESNLHWYLSFPRVKSVARRRLLQAMVAEGEVVEIALEGDRTRWFALAEDVPALEKAGRLRRSPSSGTTMLSPFDSLLWHRVRAEKLFGYDYKIEVYTPSHKRRFGYYVLPIWHDGQFIGQLDAKHHRGDTVLEVKRVAFEPWLVRGEPSRAPHWGALDLGAAITGSGQAIASLAEFLGAATVKLGRVEPLKLRGPLARAIREAMPAAGPAVAREPALVAAETD